MNEETVKTLVLCAFFVFLFGALGFIAVSIVNTAKVYINSPTVQMYYIWVKNQMFSGTFLPYYLVAGILCAGVGLFIIYLLSPIDST